MAIIQMPLPIAANTGVKPNIKTMTVTDNLATLTAAGYLNANVLQGYTISVDDILHVIYSYNQTTGVGSFGIFTVSISNGVITLTEDTTTSSVTYTSPSIANHFAVYSNTTGNITKDVATAINGGNIQAGLSGTAGTVASFPGTALKGSLKVTAVANTGDTVTTISNAAMGQASTISIIDPGAATANFILSASAASTQTISTGLSITGAANNVQTTSGGNLIAGSSGADGLLISYPATASKGSLIVKAVDNTGNTDTTISNAAMGQASVISIPDPAAATANFVVAPAALVSGNIVKASGTAGLIVDAGFALKANTTAAYAGGGTSNAYVATGLTASSIVTAVILASTNAVSIAKAVPSADTLTVTFSADPGAATTVSWIAITPAV
jgi:hypothetical protein